MHQIFKTLELFNLFTEFSQFLNGWTQRVIQYIHYIGVVTNIKMCRF